MKATDTSIHYAQAIYTYVELEETFVTFKFDQQDAKETLNNEWLILNGG